MRTSTFNVRSLWTSILTSVRCRHRQTHVNSVRCHDRDFSALALKTHIDYRHIRDHRDRYQQNALDRGSKVDIDEIVALYTQVNVIKTRLNRLREEQNRTTRAVGAASNDDERRELIANASALKQRAADDEQQLKSTETRLEDEASRLPNMTSAHTPIGNEDEFTVMKYLNEPTDTDEERRRRRLDHMQLASRWSLIDLDTASFVSGTRFYYLLNECALMETALIQYAMHTLVRRGFTPIITPDLVHNQFVSATGFQPRDDGAATQTYRVANAGYADLSLVATSEIPLAAMYTHVDMEDTNALIQPIRSVAYGHAFRTEAGGAGTINRGIYRVHQFSKVEMFVVSNDTASHDVFDDLVNIQCEMFSALGLYCRVIEVASRDLGAPAYRKVDIEAFMPGRVGGDEASKVDRRFGEISSASNCTDYQARRLGIRYRNPATKTMRYAHTLNATAMAVPRVIIALLEQGQREDGTIAIPLVLQPYMMGIDTIPSPLITNRQTTRKTKT